MKERMTMAGWIFLVALVSVSTADTFRHKETGESFTGFVTQKTTGNKTLVYNSEESKMMPVVLSDYTVTYNTQGRRETVALLRINQPEILLSEVICKKAAAAIAEASNKGPQAIIIQIDSPGGRADYVKHIALAVSQTTNCPVYAYISGENYGGAYASAALIALGCNKVYINPTAGVGAVATAYGDLVEGDYGNYLETYAPGLLVTYSAFANSLAQKHERPALLAKALVDKSLSVVEVADKDGSRKFVRTEDRQPTQTIIRTLSEGMSESAMRDLSTVTAIDVVGKVLNLTSQQAVDFGLVDAIADSVQVVLADMKLNPEQLVPIAGIDKTVKKFVAASRNIAEGLIRIERFEEEVALLNDQFTKIDKQLRTATETRELARGNPGSVYQSTRDRYRRPDNSDYYNRNNRYDRQRNRSGYTNQVEQRVITTTPSVDIQYVYQQLTGSLQGLIGQYRRTLNLVKRWPGALPVGQTESNLQGYLDSASSELEKLSRYQPPYLYQNQRVPQVQPRVRRR